MSVFMSCFPKLVCGNWSRGIRRFLYSVSVQDDGCCPRVGCEADTRTSDSIIRMTQLLALNIENPKGFAISQLISRLARIGNLALRKVRPGEALLSRRLRLLWAGLKIWSPPAQTVWLVIIAENKINFNVKTIRFLLNLVQILETIAQLARIRFEKCW